MAAIQSSEILFRLSVDSTGGGITAQADPNASLGEYCSTTEVSATALNNLFDDVTGAENAASDVEYRCIFVHNTNASNTFENVVVWLSAETAGGADIAIAVDTTAASSYTSGTQQALGPLADEGDSGNILSGAGLTFSAPTTKGGGLSLGNIAVDNVRAIWIRRTATNSAALNNDSFTLRVEGDTGAL